MAKKKICYDKNPFIKNLVEHMEIKEIRIPVGELLNESMYYNENKVIIIKEYERIHL